MIFFVITEIVCITTGTSSALRKNRSMRVPIDSLKHPGFDSDPSIGSDQRRGATFFAHLKHYYWEEPILYKHFADQMIRRCIPEDEMGSILNHCHTLPCEGHFGG